jgi:hypothetical protein
MFCVPQRGQVAGTSDAIIAICSSVVHNNVQPRASYAQRPNSVNAAHSDDAFNHSMAACFLGTKWLLARSVGSPQARIQNVAQRIAE